MREIRISFTRFALWLALVTVATETRRREGGFVALAFTVSPKCSLLPTQFSSKLRLGGRRHSHVALHAAASTAASLGDTAAVPIRPASVTVTGSSSQETTEVVQSATEDGSKGAKKAARLAKIRAEGGPLAFDTPYGALNPFGLYWGFLSVFLGLIWYAALTSCRLVYMITGNRFDRYRRIPIFFAHVWGTLLMRLSRSFPEIENREALNDLCKSRRAAMFVANHNSWLDIPFLGASIGWRNYKMVAKKELLKVPILGPAISVGGNVVVDRTDRRSQLRTLKTGIQWLKDGVNLCTFPEGTRTRTGRLMQFKNGAFKMAYKAGAPVVPISIVGADKAMPVDWMFPYRPSRGVAKVVVHPPVESEGKTEAELAQAVRESIIAGLPEEQRPLESDE